MNDAGIIFELNNVNGTLQWIAIGVWSIFVLLILLFKNMGGRKPQ